MNYLTLEIEMGRVTIVASVINKIGGQSSSLGREFISAHLAIILLQK